jgi:hypothetical protein
MYRIIDKRGSGKTSRLMLLAKETDATIVCAMPRAFEAKAQAYGITGLKFMSYHEFLESRGENYKEKFLIDEIDGLLKRIDGNVIGYCLTPDD